jgi:hypothetical protein
MNWKRTTAIPARLNNQKSNFINQIFLDQTIYFYLKLKIHFNDSKLPKSILIHLKVTWSIFLEHEARKTLTRKKFGPSLIANDIWWWSWQSLCRLYSSAGRLSGLSTWYNNWFI